MLYYTLKNLRHFINPIAFNPSSRDLEEAKDLSLSTSLELEAALEAASEAAS